HLAEGFRIALDTIRGNPVRSALTILGVAVGVAVVVLLAAFVTGLRSSIEESFESSGPRNFMITRFDFTAARGGYGTGRPPWWDKPVIVPLEADRVAQLDGVESALYNVNVTLVVDYQGRRISNVQAYGYSADWTSYTQGDFAAGRDFTAAEVRQSRAAVVLSSALAEELFGYLDPIGRRVGLDAGGGTREDFTVVGVFEPVGNIFTSVVKHWAVIPYTSALKRLQASDEKAQILVVPRDSFPLDLVKDQVTGALRGMRGLGSRVENDFALIESAQILAIIDKFTSMIFLGMLALTSVALMVGGVGVIGIMLISVTERTREIGVRKAVGATGREIMWQFLVESTVLTVLGTAVGMLVGGGVAGIVSALTPLPARVPVWAVVTALVMAALTGMLFGLLPAYRASRLEPVVALRFE
ncbi:MAG: FtsX-like permease family protein, partial [Gemmatimonadetes bacterium]|nr:FtsX-like permease family protein [Gemmatimonadota bacterium]